jgi:hypothetical protein
MIGTKCPGQDMRYWTAEDIHEEKCPQCGEMIEFFKTDIRLRCRNCKTRVANPRFNMGCAEWCAYAEQCLGPAARGLKTKSLKVVMEEELTVLLKEMPQELKKIQKLLTDAEIKCKSKKIDILPVITAIVIVSLIELKVIENVYSFLDELKAKHTLPQQALKDSETIAEEVLSNKIESEAAAIVAGLLN